MEWAAQSPSGGHRLGGGVQAAHGSRQTTPVDIQPVEQGDPTTPQGQLLPPPEHPPGAPRKAKPPPMRRHLSLSPGAPVRRLDFDGMQLGPPADAHAVPATAPAPPPVAAGPAAVAAPQRSHSTGLGGVQACPPPAPRPSKPSKLQRIR
ncbi:hypothetical protein ABPG75_013520 [Micractinium tetrahymenae]